MALYKVCIRFGKKKLELGKSFSVLFPFLCVGYYDGDGASTTIIIAIFI